MRDHHKKPSRWRTLWLAAGIVIGVPAQAADRGKAIDALVEAERARQDVPGVAVGVVQHGEVIRAAGYGLADVENKVPVKPETLFQTGSVGKQFTAVAVMTLVEDGRIGLEDPVGKYLKGAPPAWRDMKVRHLLTHTSGLPSDFAEPFDLTREFTDDQLVANAFKLKLQSRPGERWSYSNVGFVMLGILVQRASGRFYGDLLAEKVFRPLGMKTARVIDLHAIIPNRSAGYEMTGDELKNQDWVSPSLNRTADGSLYLSVLDYIAWDKGLREGGVLKPESWRQVYTPVRLNSGKTYPYGFGWFLDEIGGQPVRQHTGAWQGFRTKIARYLGDDLTVIVLCNSARGNPSKFADAIAALFNPALAPSTAPIADTEPRVTAQLRSLLADAAAGKLQSSQFAFVSADLLKEMSKAYAPALKRQGQLQRLELVERKPLGDDVAYRYRATYDGGVVMAGVELAANGKATSLNLRLLPQQVLVHNAEVIDGTGARHRKIDVRIVGDRIDAIGDLQPEPTDTVIDARGLTLAPGFVDTHSHHEDGIEKEPGALAAVSQGITTIIAGQDGASKLPLGPWFKSLENKPAAINIAAYVGHGSVRDKVMGKDFRREATPAELLRMKALVDEGMRDGALGLSSGLEYDPGIYASHAEVLALAGVAAAHGGRYISHIRSEDRHFYEAIDELLNIGRVTRMPVQVSHIKVAMRSLWGQGSKLVDKLDQARAEGIDVTADIYPYPMWQSTLTVMYPQRNFADRAETEFILQNVAGPEDLVMGRFDPQPEYVGKTVGQIAQLRHEDPATTLMALIAMAGTDGAKENVVATSMKEPDIERILRWPFANICTDGELNGPHPRGFGSFPRVLGHYVRDEHVVPLEEAIRKMTSLAAANVGLRRRGTIAVGNYADLVLFDPEHIADRATLQEPHLTSTGIDTVWVNGQVVYAGGKVTGRAPGRVLRRPASSAP